MRKMTMLCLLAALLMMGLGLWRGEGGTCLLYTSGIIRNVNNGGVDLAFPQETGQLHAVF